jgi:hypothetical protein
MGEHRHLHDFRGHVPTPFPLRSLFITKVSAKVANRAASLAAVGEYSRALKALNSNPVASGRGVHHVGLSVVLHLHKDEMQARTEPSTAPHFVKGDKVSVVTTNLFLRGQSNKKVKDIQLGNFTMEEQIGKHIYILELPTIVRLRLVFHVNNLRPCSTAPLRLVVPVTLPEGDDDEFEVSHIFDVCISRYLDDEANICFS